MSRHNLFGQDDPVPSALPPHLQFFVLGFRQFPRPGWLGLGAHTFQCPPPVATLLKINALGIVLTVTAKQYRVVLFPIAMPA